MPFPADVESFPIKDRASWLAMRKLDVTASDVGAVCGVHPNASALSVWAEKTGNVVVEENNAMRRGRWLEDGVIAAVREEREDWQIRKPGVYLRSPSLRLGCTPDALLWSGPDNERPDGVLQCKVVAGMVFDRDWADGPPIYYQLQTMVEAVLCGVDQAWLAALVIREFTADLELVPVRLNDAAFGKVCAEVGKFWKLVDAGGRPAADYGKDAATIAALHKSMKGGAPRDLNGDNRMVELCTGYQAGGSAIRVIEERRSAAKAEIIEKLGGAPKAVCGAFKISNTAIIAQVKAHTREYDQLTVSGDKP